MSVPQKRLVSVDQPAIYRIRIQGRLGRGAARRFGELTVTVEVDLQGYPITEVAGQVADQAALHGLIAHVRDLGLPLLGVELVTVMEVSD